MIKTTVIAALAVLGAGAAGAAYAQAQPGPAPAARTAPQAGAPGDGMGRGGMGGPGMGMHRPGMRDGMGRGGRGFGRGPRATPEQMRERNAQLFAQMDANRDGRATFEEFRAFQDRQRLERQRRMFQRFSNGQDSITLDQLNARAAERFNQRQGGPGRDGGPGTPPSAGGAPAR